MMRAIAATGVGPAPSSSAATSAGCSGQPSRDVKKHEGVDVNHAILEQMQCEHADFMVLATIAGHFASTGEEDEVVGAVPLLDDVQALVDFAAEVFTAKVST